MMSIACGLLTGISSKAKRLSAAGVFHRVSTRNRSALCHSSKATWVDIWDQPAK